MQHCENKHIWIIGASSGIGYALAKELAARGAMLILSARSKDALDQLNTELGGEHFVYPLDVSDSEMVKRTVHAVQVSVPKVDSVINFAAIYVPEVEKSKAPEIIQSIISVNLMGTFYLVNAVLPMLEQQDKGQLVLCGSVAGYRGLPNGQPYSATKAGVINFAESLRSEVSKHIDIKVINSGFVKTPMTDQNSFPMPMIISAQEAAKAIADGLGSSAFEIHFPKRFTWFMKFLRWLPSSIYFWIARRYIK